MGVAEHIGDTEMLADLLPIISSDEAEGYTGPVFTFCSLNDLANTEKLYKDDQTIIWKKYGKKKSTFLHLAAGFDRPAIIEFLFSKGARQIKDVVGNTPLHTACVRGTEKTIESLLKDPAALSAENIDGDHPIHVAAAAGNLAALRVLVETGGVSCSSVSYSGNTPLHSAAEYGHINVIQYLLRLGVQVNPRNERGESPLHLAAGAAVNHNVAQHVQLLLDAGAELGAKSKAGERVIHFAAKSGSIAAFQLLLDAGAPVRRVSKIGDRYYEVTEGENILTTVLTVGCEGKVKLLLQKMMSSRHKIASLESSCYSKFGRLCLLMKADISPQEIALSSLCETLAEECEEENSVMRRILQLDSSVVERLFDNCLLMNETSGVMYGEVEYDFFLFNHKDCEMTLLDLILETGKLQILDHPLVETIVELKWRRVYKLYLFFLTLFFVHMCSQAAYILVEFGTVYVEQEVENISFALWTSTLVINSIISILLILKAINFFCARHCDRGSIPSVMNIVECYNMLFLIKELVEPVFCFVLLFTKSREVACLLILMSSAQFMIHVSRIPRIGNHVFITAKVFGTIFEFFVSYVLVIFGFAIAFHISLKKVESFNNLGDSFIKVLTMLMGEFDYSNLVEGNNLDWMSRIIFVLFLFTMSIALMNLVVGLAIGDIRNMRKDAHIHKLISTVAAIRLVDSLCAFLRKQSCKLIPGSRLTSEKTGKFKEIVTLDLQERRYCQSNKILLKDVATDRETYYTCSASIRKKVADIIYRRSMEVLGVSRVENEAWYNSLLAKISSLERKIEILSSTAQS